MMNRLIRPALLIVLAASMSCGYSGMNAQAESPTAHLSVVRGSTSAAALSPAAIVYTQPPSASGGLFQSSRNGSDYDRYVWENFTIQSSASVTITAVEWLGGYDPARFGSGGPVLSFTVAIYSSIGGGAQPDVTHPPLVEYQAAGNAGETPVGSYGGITTYGYSFTLPAPLQASGGTKYWVLVEASQGGIPDWGIAAGTGGDAQHFQGFAAAGDIFYHFVPGDAAFTLLGITPRSYGAYLPLVWK